jgi:hypothetical protein
VKLEAIRVKRSKRHPLGRVVLIDGRDAERCPRYLAHCDEQDDASLEARVETIIYAIGIDRKHSTESADIELRAFIHADLLLQPWHVLELLDAAHRLLRHRIGTHEHTQGKHIYVALLDAHRAFNVGERGYGPPAKNANRSSRRDSNRAKKPMDNSHVRSTCEPINVSIAALESPSTVTGRAAIAADRARRISGDISPVSNTSTSAVSRSRS